MEKRKQKRENFKSYWHIGGKYQKHSRQFTLEAGMTGFLCTYNFHEKECVRDAYKILDEFANEIYGVEKPMVDDAEYDVQEKKFKVEGDSEDAKKKKEDDDEDEDIADALNKEIAQMKAELKKPAKSKRFQRADAGVKNVTFINTTLPDPLELALSIIKKLDETKEQRTRFLLRLVPIQVVCKAKMPEILDKADKLFEKYFAQEPKTFSIVFNRHFNNTIQRNDIIEELAELVFKKNPGNKVNLKNPEIAIVVEVIKGHCLLSIAPEYFKYKKYNLLELCNVKTPENPSKGADGSDDKCEGQKADPEVSKVPDAESPEDLPKVTAELLTEAPKLEEPPAEKIDEVPPLV